MFNIFRIVLINIILFLFLLVFIEIILVKFFPIVHGGVYSDYYTGNIIRPHDSDTKFTDCRFCTNYIMKKNIKFIHKANEFEVVMSTNKYGLRSTFNDHYNYKQNIFIGDSFAFGHGVNDNENFVNLFCKKNKLNCLNMGMPGTAQKSQIVELKSFLHNNDFSSIDSINLFIFLSCNIYIDGNDLNANYNEFLVDKFYSHGLESLTHLEKTASDLAQSIYRGHENKVIKEFYVNKKTKNYIIKYIQRLLYKFEIAKRMTLPLISSIKFNLSKCSNEDLIENYYQYTLMFLDDFYDLSQKFNSKIYFYIINPYYELENNTFLYKKLMQEKNYQFEILSKVLNKDDYYSFDGHLNSSGHYKIFKYLDKIYN